MGGYSTVRRLPWREVSVQRAQPAGHRACSPRRRCTYGQYYPRCRTVVTPSRIFSTPAPAWASTCSPSRRSPAVTLSYGTEVDRRHSEMGYSAARRLVDPAALFGLSAKDHAAVVLERLQQHQSGFRQQLSRRRRRSPRQLPQAPCGMAITGKAGAQTNCLQVRPGVAPGARGTRRRRLSDIVCRLRLRLQHARQQQKPDQRRAISVSGRILPASAATSPICASTVDVRAYYEVVSDLVGMLHLQGGDMVGSCRRASTAKCACSTTSRWAPIWCAASSRPASVRATSRRATSNDALGGTMYWGASLEFQYPFYFLPKDTASAAPCSSIPDRCGATRARPRSGDRRNQRPGQRHRRRPCSTANAACNMPTAPASRASVGASIIWDSPFGPLRFDFAYPILKQGYDRTQFSPSAAERNSDLRPKLYAADRVDARFYQPSAQLTIGEIAALTRAKLRDGDPLGPPHLQYRAARHRRPADISFLDNSKYLADWPATRAGACLIAPRFVGGAAPRSRCLETPHPYRGLRRRGARAVSAARLRPSSLFETQRPRRRRAGASRRRGSKPA